MAENSLKSSLPQNFNKEGNKEKIPKNIGQFIMGIYILNANIKEKPSEKGHSEK